MNNPVKPFYSAEIRWFSKTRDQLFGIYAALSGESKLDSERTDYYLKVNSENAGIKIREKKHEIKTKLVPDINHPLGKLETWVKWSYQQGEESILHRVDKTLLSDWTIVEKKRWKKKYEILKDGSVIPNNRRIDDGCGVEFTEINVDGKSLFTFGLESFAFNPDESQSPERVIPNIKATLEFLQLEVSEMRSIECLSYPEFLKKKNI